MLVDAALVACWLAAMTYAIWHCATSEDRHDRTAHRRLLAELRRHNVDIYEQHQP